jgi:hypothetical protein
MTRHTPAHRTFGQLPQLFGRLPGCLPYAEKIMEIYRIKPIFEGSGISMEFNIVRYALIFLTYFGHIFGTNDKQTIAFDRPPRR